MAALEANPPALRQRIIRFVAESEFGVSLHRVHTLAVARLVTDWHGQGALDLPGVRVVRHDGWLDSHRAWTCSEQGTRSHGTRDIDGDLTEILYRGVQIRDRLAELSRRIEADYAGKDLLLVGVLKGAVMVMADLARELKHPSLDGLDGRRSYGSGTTSSGVVRILKDLDTDLTGRHVLIVEDIIDSGLTLSWLLANLKSAVRPRSRSAPCCASRMPRGSRST